ncbi:MAG: hypothetical protein PHF70_00685 [Opitutales bacterium]|nr:hypothetical protein [Opitutales bacterium]
MPNPLRLKPHRAPFPQRLTGILGFLLSALMLPAATLHLDAVKGNDSSGDGSSGAPFRSFERALAALQSRDTLLMYDGNYGDIFAGRTNHPAWQAEPVQHFSDWVNVETAPGHHPTLNTLSLGTVNIPDSGSPRQKIPFSQKGNVDLWMVFDGLTVEDGIGTRTESMSSVPQADLCSTSELRCLAETYSGTTQLSTPPTMCGPAYSDAGCKEPSTA